jgi:hypothetical protein
LELLAERALMPLSPEEEVELTSLLQRDPSSDIGIFDRITAAVAIAHAHAPEEPLPDALARRLELDAARFFGAIA